jgi:hypothetical protein
MSGGKIGTFFSLAQKTGPSIEEQAVEGNYVFVISLSRKTSVSDEVSIHVSATLFLLTFHL